MDDNYLEVQQFRNPFIFILLIALLGLAGWAVVAQIFMGIPFGTNPAPDTALVLFLLIPVLFLLFFIFMKQQTYITKTAIDVVIIPFGRRKITWNRVQNVYVRQYRPLMEYGGWGIRYGFGKRGVAYSVGGGNIGLQLELDNGKKVLIGTKRPEELKEFLQQHQLLKEA